MLVCICVFCVFIMFEFLEEELVADVVVLWLASSDVVIIIIIVNLRSTD